MNSVKAKIQKLNTVVLPANSILPLDIGTLLCESILAAPAGRRQRAFEIRLAFQASTSSTAALQQDYGTTP